MLKADKYSVNKGFSLSSDPVEAAREFYDSVDAEHAAVTIFFCSPSYNLDVLAASLKKCFGNRPLVGCTTAGEITPMGYLEGSITGFSLPKSEFGVAVEMVDQISGYDFTRVATAAKRARDSLGLRADELTKKAFGFLMTDGLSCIEELVVSGIYRSLGGIHMFGGSAADSGRYRATHIYYDGRFRSDATVLTLVKTDRPFTIFKTDHFQATDEKIVITDANPAERVVREINGRPALEEYARLIGSPVDEVDYQTFGKYAFVARVGGTYYVRGIQRATDEGHLRFLCAIDEGVVLSLAKAGDLARNLEETFSAIKNRMGTPEIVIACDSMHRNLELDYRGIRPEVSELMALNNVIGFSTYGEQINFMHTSNTFTGIAIGNGESS